MHRAHGASRCARERPGDRAGPGHAGVRRRLGGPRLRRRRPRGRRRRAAASRVPPDDPRYTLRRVWLTKEEEEGYYYGFANRACGRSATTSTPGRPSTPPTGTATARSTRSSPTRCSRRPTGGPALVLRPGLPLRAAAAADQGSARPDLVVAQFWHIPWPNPETFGVCPWQDEILDGMLGNDLLGFHTQYHCNNFLETRGPRRRVRGSTGSGSRSPRQRHDTLVRPFPISVDPALRRRDLADDWEAGAAAPAGASARRPAVPRGGRRPRRLHEGHPGALRARSTACFDAAPGVPRAVPLRPARRPEPDAHRRATATSNEEVDAARRADQLASSASGRWRPIVFLNEHHEPRGHLRPLPRGGRRAW